MQVPEQLRYNNVRPKGFFSSFKKWEVQPQNSAYFWPGQIIQIQIQGLSKTVVDPFRSHLQIQVATDVQALPVGLLAVDSSAQSFIDMLVINSNNRQVQRIQNYGTLATFLTDVGIADLYCQGKQTEGLGYVSLQSAYVNYLKSNCGSNTVTTQYPSGQANQPYYSTFFSPANSFPSCPNYIPVSSITNAFDLQTGQSIYSGMSIWETDLAVKSMIMGSNMIMNNKQCTYDSSSTNGLIQAVTNNGFAKHLRSQYLCSLGSGKFVDSTSSLTNLNPVLNTNVFNSLFPGKYNSKTPVPYSVTLPLTLTMRMATQNDNFINLTANNTPNFMGFSSLMSPLLAKGGFQPFISPTVPQVQIQNGLILAQKIPIATRIFKIPLISAVIGLLIPANQFVLLPVQAYNNLLLQFTIDQYAMYTSGYNDVSQLDNLGMAVQQKRAFVIKRVVYNMHTYQFFNSRIDQYVRTSLMKQIVINVNMWTLGNQYQIANGQQIQNAFPVACNAQALNEVLVLFQTNDHQNYSFCRRHFRLSNNITRFQLRVNMQYYPPLPICGNGGNPIAVDSTGDNSQFVQNIYWTNNYMFQSNTPLPKINAYNFAINQRCYNIGNTNTLYDPDMYTQGNSYSFTSDSIQCDTALGFPYIHENRYIGKAAYTYSFQPYAHSGDLMIGLNCQNSKQFDVIFSCNSQGYFQRSQTMYIFTRSSNIVVYSPNGIYVAGK